MRLPTVRSAFAVTAATTALLLTAACGGDTDAASSATDTSSSAAPAADPDATYTDGTYEASGSYANPGGQSSVDVTVTIADNTVTDVEVEPGATGTSLGYQEKFISGIADEVVGKSLNEIDVSKVSGSSLTSTGFNEALDQIRQDAQA
jgi:uncharacterized protein with FMN-binding domain